MEEHMGAYTKDVLLDIKGIRTILGQDETTVFAVEGSLTFEDGRYTLKYADERGLGTDSETEVVVEDGAVRMTRHGEDMTEMFFRKNTPYASFYKTPFGSLDINVLPTLVRTDMGTEKGKIELEYIMSIAGSQFVNRLNISYKDDQKNHWKGELQ